MRSRFTFQWGYKGMSYKKKAKFKEISVGREVDMAVEK